MRVSIEHSEEKTGMFKKRTRYILALTVNYSDEELQIINDCKIKDDAVFEDPIRPGKKEDEPKDYYHIRHFMKGRTWNFNFDTPLEAKNYEAEVTEALKRHKEYIEANRGVEKKSTTFEL